MQLFAIIILINLYQTKTLIDNPIIIWEILLKYYPGGTLEERLEKRDIINFL